MISAEVIVSSTLSFDEEAVGVRVIFQLCDALYLHAKIC